MITRRTNTEKSIKFALRIVVFNKIDEIFTKIRRNLQYLGRIRDENDLFLKEKLGKNESKWEDWPKIGKVLFFLFRHQNVDSNYIWKKTTCSFFCFIYLKNLVVLVSKDRSWLTRPCLWWSFFNHMQTVIWSIHTHIRICCVTYACVRACQAWWTRWRSDGEKDHKI